MKDRLLETSTKAYTDHQGSCAGELPADIDQVQSTHRLMAPGGKLGEAKADEAAEWLVDGSCSQR